MRPFRVTIIILLMLMFYSSLMAQSLIRGKVVNETNSALPGATINIKGASTATTTDENGDFSISVPSGAVLAVHFVGYSTIEVPVDINQQGELTIRMQLLNDEMLEEVVINGYTSKALSENSSSVSVVSAKKLIDVTSNDVASLLQGKAPGVVVSNSSGNPNVGANITIRGSNSISAGAQPLYVVDGIIGGRANPNDIESVTILKDAAATGLYGSRAANGVIIITTKTGQAGKTRIGINATTGISKLSTGNFKLMNSRQLYDFQKSFVPENVFAVERPDSLLRQQTDWLDLAYRTGVTKNYDINVSGGSEKTKFFVSGNYFAADGILRHTGNKVFNFRANLSHEINKKLKLTVRLNGSSRNFENEASGGYGALAAIDYMPWDNPYNPDGSIKNGTEAAWTQRYQDNFMHGWQYNFDKGRELMIYGDLNLDYKILPNLSFATYNRASYGNKKNDVYYDVRSVAGKGLGQLSNDYYYDNQLITSNRLKYDNDFGRHSVSAIAVFEAEKNYHDQNSLHGSGFAQGIHIMEAAATINRATPAGDEDVLSPGTITESNFTKGLVQVDYNYDNRYFLVGSYINEASSRFGANNRAGNFYTFGSSWILTNERFMKNSSTVEFLKLRASYGVTGNANIGDYQSLGIYSLTGQYSGNPASIPFQLANKDLTWEKAKTLNLGVDIGLLKAVSLTVDWYNKTSDALLLDVPLPYTSGYESVFQNVGAVRNRGIEFNLTTKNFTGKNFRWETNFNMAFNRNKVLSLNKGISISLDQQRISEGHDLYSWYMRKWVGVDPANGDPLWETVTTDGEGHRQVGTTSNYSDATLQFVGTASPDFTGGISNDLTYKGFSLHFFFNFVSGNSVLGTLQSDGSEINANTRQLQDDEVRWLKPGDIATEPKAVYGGNQNSDLPSSRNLEDGSYIRLRNLTFGYQLPPTALDKLKVQSAKIFLSADNLWTLTGYSGMDPEQGVRSNFTLNGDGGNNFQQNSRKYPISKYFSFGINIQF